MSSRNFVPEIDRAFDGDAIYMVLNRVVAAMPEEPETVVRKASLQAMREILKHLADETEWQAFAAAGYSLERSFNREPSPEEEAGAFYAHGEEYHDGYRWYDPED